MVEGLEIRYVDPVTEEARQHRATVLFVDDEINILSSLKRLFRPVGYSVLLANNVEEGLELLNRESVDLVVSDMRMPKMNGAVFLAEVKNQWPEIVRILLTGYEDVRSIVEAINSGEIFKYVNKPWNDDELISTVKIGLECRFADEEREKLLRLLHLQNKELTAKTMALQTALEEIETLKGIIPICSYCH